MKVKTNSKAGACPVNVPKGTVDVWAGPIWNNGEAPSKCPRACGALKGKWNGQWTTPANTWGQDSVCGCKFPTGC